MRRMYAWTHPGTHTRWVPDQPTRNPRGPDTMACVGSCLRRAHPRALSETRPDDSTFMACPAGEAVTLILTVSRRGSGAPGVASGA